MVIFSPNAGDSDDRKNGKSLLPWLLGISAVVYGTMYFTAKPTPFIQPHIIAATFVWPTGCENKKYKTDDKISESCRVPSNIFPDAEKYNFLRSKGLRRPPYYRLGNDAVQFGCLMGTCTVDDEVSDVFYQK